MAEHPAGDGVAWEEDVDADRPHGLDYRYTNHVAKAIRKRLEKEHETFADDTVGGEHIPGGCAVLLQGDGTADISAAVDATTMVGSGMGWSKTGYLFCQTATGADPTTIYLDPHSICAGGDMTWTGEWQFDASVSFQDPIEATAIFIDGSFEVSGPSMFDGTVTFTDLVDVSDLHAAGDVSITGGLVVDGTTNLHGAIDLSSPIGSGPFAIFGTCTTQGTGGVDLSTGTVYCVCTDGIIGCYATAMTGGGDIDILIGDTTDPTKVRAYMGYSGLASAQGSCYAPIKKAQYWCISKSGSCGTVTVWWQPIGIGGCASL